MCRVRGVTTDPQQTTLISGQELQQHAEAAVEINLQRLRAWSKLPDERTDWDLEIVLDELGAAAQALRALRNDRELPF